MYLPEILFFILNLGVLYLVSVTRYLLALNTLLIATSDGSGPKKTGPGQARALNVGLGPGPGLSPSFKAGLRAGPGGLDGLGT